MPTKRVRFKVPKTTFLVTETKCPLCHGTCSADIDLDNRTQSVTCTDCGYGANSETVPDVNALKGRIPKILTPFVRLAKPYDSIGLRMDSVPWWPSEHASQDSRYRVEPVVAGNRLRWRRHEKADEKWPYEMYADYAAFSKADRTTPKANRNLSIMQSIEKLKPRFRLLNPTGRRTVSPQNVRV